MISTLAHYKRLTIVSRNLLLSGEMSFEFRTVTEFSQKDESHRTTEPQTQRVRIQTVQSVFSSIAHCRFTHDPQLKKIRTPRSDVNAWKYTYTCDL